MNRNVALWVAVAVSGLDRASRSIGACSRVGAVVRGIASTLAGALALIRSFEPGRELDVTGRAT